MKFIGRGFSGISAVISHQPGYFIITIKPTAPLHCRNSNIYGTTCFHNVVAKQTVCTYMTHDSSGYGATQYGLRKVSNYFQYVTNWSLGEYKI